MNLCQDHWDRLKVKIAERGLSSFISGSGPAVAARVAGQLENAARGEAEVNKRTFDPLMNASIAIMSNCMQGAPNPLEMLVVAEGSERPPCPLCFMNNGRYQAAQQAKLHGTPEEQFQDADNRACFDVWLDRAADEQRAKAVELGLLASG